MPEDTLVTLPLEGLNCAGCVGRAERAVQAVPGIGSVAVNLATRKGTVDLGTARLSEVADALAQAGYPARQETVMLDISGMTCAGCAGRIERALATLPGVVDASVNFASRTAHVTVLSGAAEQDTLVRAVSDAGYEARVQTIDAPMREDASEEAELVTARRAALVALVLAAPVFLLEMGGHLVPALHHLIGQSIGHQTSWMIQFVLTTAVLAGPGRAFFAKGVPALLRGAPDMNSLVALGTSAAWGYSTVALFAPALLPDTARAVYFEAAAVIVALVLVGRWLEARARGRTGAAIRRLVGLQPKTTRVERDGTVIEAPIAEVRVEDILHLRPGERVAVDGAVIEGESFIDESMITGEPAPVAKRDGDWVVAGTVNGSGFLRYRAEKVGRDTMLAQIIAMVQQAQGAKLPIQALADKVVRVFVPVVMAIALLTVAVWLLVGPDPALSFALIAGVSVLIIACPCAMGLATPTSIMVGTGRAADMGVLFRRGDALQTLGEVRMLAFDKTGTLTLGRPVLTDFVPAQGLDEESLLRMVAAAESRSEHPIARAIMAAAEARGLDLPVAEKVEALSGLGLQARVEGHALLIGSARLMRENGVSFEGLSARYESLQADGKTPVLVACDSKIAALFGAADPVKPGARAALAALKDEGVEVAMITGDAKGTALAVARQLGIDHVEAEVLPGGKRDAVQRLRAAHGSVGFVGDGINDAPALAEADVGLAIGTGTDIAIESADVVLVSGDLAGAVNALAISRATLRNIRQNLFWAFAYNTALIPVAAGVLYPVTGLMLSPMLAAGAMAMSSLFVLSNALRLRAVQPLLREERPAAVSDIPAQPVAAE